MKKKERNFEYMYVAFLHFWRKIFRVKNIFCMNYIQQNVMWRVSYIENYRGYLKENKRLLH